MIVVFANVAETWAVERMCAAVRAEVATVTEMTVARVGAVSAASVA